MWFYQFEKCVHQIEVTNILRANLWLLGLSNEASAKETSQHGAAVFNFIKSCQSCVYRSDEIKSIFMKKVGEIKSMR